MKNVFAALEAKIMADLEACAAKIGDDLAAETKDVNDTARNWPAFDGRTTIRKNPAAPMRVAKGAFRDNVDTGESSDAITSTSQGLKSTVSFEGLTEEHETQMLADKPILEVAFNEFNFEESFRENFRKP